MALQITRLKTGSFAIVIYSDLDNEIPYDLTDALLYFHASGFGIVIDKDNDTAGGITVEIAEEGTATLVIDPADTSGFLTSGTFELACELTMIAGSPAGTYQVASGTLTVTPNVGTP